jgi:hypothetical protein
MHYQYATDVFLQKFAFCKELVKVAYNIKTIGVSSDAKMKMQIVVDGAQWNVIDHQNCLHSRSNNTATFGPIG